MSCCWIGRGGNSARTSAGRFRIIWPQSWSGWDSIDRTGWKPYAASADCSSRRRGDRVRSSMQRRTARGAGSRARRRLEPLLCNPLCRHPASNKHLHHALAWRLWPTRARKSLRAAVSTGRTVQIRTSSDRAGTHIGDFDRLRFTAPPRSENRRAGQSPLDKSANLWVSESLRCLNLCGVSLNRCGSVGV